VMNAADFFRTYLTTAIEPVEMLTEIRLPAWKPQCRWGFQEVCRREGDFAIVGAVSLLQMNDSDTCQAARLTMFGVGGTPMRLRRAEEVLRGRSLNEKALDEAAKLVSEELEPDADLHASVAYRKEVGGVLARRTLEMALKQAKGGSGA
jgi:CO/xanthine dehydrogenase FAD-binding subunit